MLGDIIARSRKGHSQPATRDAAAISTLKATNDECRLAAAFWSIYESATNRQHGFVEVTASVAG